MAQDDPKTLVSTDWLAVHLKNPDLRILDASWYLPETGRDARAEYARAHIPGARFFDIDEISDHRSALPHMAAPPEKFISRLRAMGVGDGHQVVVYDGAGLFSAARVWWNFRLMGKTDIAVLDGGMPKWLAEGRATEDMPPMMRDRHMTVQRQAHLIKDVTQVAAASKAYRTYYKKHDPEPGNEEFYLVDHSTWSYLVFPGEGLVGLFKRDETPQTMADRIGCFLDAR